MWIALAVMVSSGPNTLSFDCGATRIPKILGQLSPLVGAELRARPTLEDEVLFIHVKDVSADELLADIAKVTHCEWQVHEGVTWLTRTEGQAIQDTTAENVLNSKLIASQLVDDRKFAAKPPWDRRTAKANYEAVLADTTGTDDLHEPLSLGQRMASRLFGRMGSDEFSTLRPWESTLFFANPNRWQKPLPDASGQVLDALVTEEASAQSEMAGFDRNERIDRAARLQGGMYDLRLFEGPLMLAVEQRVSSLDELAIECTALDAHFQSLETGDKTFSLRSDPDLSSLTALPNGLQPLKAAAYSNKAVSEFAGYKLPRTPFMPGQADRPDVVDPLSFLVDDGLRKFVALENVNLVAAIPDEVTADLTRPLKTDFQFLTAFAKNVRFHLDGSCVLAEPIRREQAYQLRLGRKALTTLLQASHHRLPNLDDFGAYVLAEPPHECLTQLEQNVLAWNRIGHGTLPLQGNLIYDRESLRFYASLTQEQRTAMANTGLRYGSLDGDQRQLCLAWFMSQVRVPRPESTAEKALAQHAEALNQWAPPHDFTGHPTFILGDGDIPDASRLTMEVDRRRAVLIDDGDGGYRQLEDSRTLGYLAALQERGELLSPGYGYPVIARSQVTPATQRITGLHLLLPSLATVNTQFVDGVVEGDPVPSYTTLPDPWLKDVLNSRKVYRDAFSAGAGPNRGAIKP